MSKAVAVDCGTMFFQTASAEGEDVNIKVVRNAFVELQATEDIEETLGRNNWHYVKDKDSYYVIGEDAIKVARMFPGKVTLRRPLQDGVMNKGEKKKMLILAELIKSSIGNAPDDKSLVCTCVSSESVDGSMNSDFHRARLIGMLENNGWKVKVIEEGLAIVLAEKPVIMDGDNEVPFSGIGISCLSPSTKIYTNNGIKEIKDVVIGDKVITHNGRWKNVLNKIKKHFDGNSVKLSVTGYSDDFEYEFVDNHEIYVYREGKWQWTDSETVVVGDIVGEPIIKRDFDNSKIYLHICNRLTNSNKWDKKQVESCSNVQRFIGYFLGDGSISRLNNEGLTFDFGLNEEAYAQDVLDIAKNNFGYCGGKMYFENNDSSKRIRVRLYNKGLGNYFRNKFYDSNGEKIYPWDISRLSHSEVVGLLAGLIRSDGSIKENGLSFFNTSTNIIVLCKQLFSKLGIASSISYRKPREHKMADGRIIQGKKIPWQLNTGSKMAYQSLVNIINNINVDSSKFIEKIFINDGFCCGRIKKINIFDYSGYVYDLQVEDDHSFSGPMLTIHNCGAGRTNCVLAYRGLPVVGMSVSCAGDYIDKQVAEQTDVNISQVTAIKEKKLDFNDLDYDDDVIFALDVYYEKMIKNVIGLFAKKFQEVKSEFDAPLDIVVAGGTATPNGFCNKLKSVLSKLELPFQIKDVRLASDPRNTVVRGCLTQALVSQKKLNKGNDSKKSEKKGDKVTNDPNDILGE